MSKVEVYDTDQSTVLKKIETDYNLDTAYVSRRIIGLPSETRSYGVENSTLVLASKATYAYDEENFSQETNQNISSVIQHDNTNYSASFITGRGNLTSVTRHDVLSKSASVTSKVRYDIAGSVVAQLDPLNRKVRIEYTDVFNDTTTPRNTFAYPTKLIDTTNQNTSNNFSQVKYRFDTGANVWAESPGINSITPGKESVREYDSLGRLSKETLVNTGAYTRYEYPTNAIQSKVYATIIDAGGNGVDSSDEVYSESWTDGAGRVLRSRTEHPGSTGGWTGSLAEYDILGRTLRSTVPTEISVSGNTWTPAGDDDRSLDSNNNPVWLWTSQEHDWKNRVTREINTDGTDRLYSYEGCGCAGGQVTTIQSELVPKEDESGNARRTQKIYQDILGRTYKTEILNWSGAVYTTTVQTFNRRDQISNTRQYDGTTSSSTYQDVTMTYDGHGRMKTRHYPIEDAATDTTWIYNTDDSIQQIIDPRGAITNFVYDTTRGLLTQVNYQVPSNSNIPVSATVNYEYDDLGNRTSIETVGISEKTYTYDELSRLTSEEVSFDALSSNTNNPYTISYTYNLSGGLKSVTDPFGSTVEYTNDRTGKLTAVGGTSYGDNTTGDYAENIKYRAFGQIKQLNFVLPNYETPLIKMEYDNRLRVNHSEVTLSSQTSGYLLKSDYTYAADGRTMSKNDLQDDKWDQTLKYDFAGRIVFNQFGMGLGYNDISKRVYEQNIEYDAFSMMSMREGVHWGSDIYFSESYVKGRIQNSNVDYDASGNIVGTGYNDSDPDSYNYTTFDAAGRRTVYLNSEKGPFGGTNNVVQQHKTESVYDGEGRPVIEKEGWRHFHFSQPPGEPLEAETKHYQIWSTVLGSSLTMLDKNGGKEETKVFAGGAVIAKQKRFVNTQQTTIDSVEWTTADPVTGTRATITYSSTYGVNSGTEEFEPLGQKISNWDPSSDNEPPPDAPEQIGSAADPEWQCNENLRGFWGGFSGMPFHCQKKALMEAGSRLPWEDEFEERIEYILHDSPLPKFDPVYNSPSDTMLTYALTSTAKKDNEEKKKECLIEKGEAQCEKVAAVEIKEPQAPEIPDDFRGADVSDVIPLTFTPISRNDIDTLKNQLKDIVSDNLCNKFITSVLNELKPNAGFETTNIVELFDLITSNSENLLYWVNYSENQISRGLNPSIAGGAKFNVVNGKVSRELQLDTGHSGKMDGSFDNPTHSLTVARIATLVHELIHLYAKGDDDKPTTHLAMAKAAQSAAKELFKGRRIREIDEEKEKGGYFGNYFTDACFRGKDGIRK